MTHDRIAGSRGGRSLRAATPALGAVLALGLTLTGCASSTTTRTRGTERLTTGLPAGSSAPTPAPSDTTASVDPEGPDASDSPDPALSGQPLPTLPPGDPGTGSPVPGDGGTNGDDEAHGPMTEVPPSALLDTETVAALAGGDWTATTAPRGWCATPRTPGASVSRAQLLTSGGGRLVQSVSAYADARAAVRAVATATARLQDCGFAVDRDPRLGEASELLTRPADGTDTGGTGLIVLVLAAEGVGVVLLASGSPAQRGTWEALADLALGSSCAAAVHGCH